MGILIGCLYAPIITNSVRNFETARTLDARAREICETAENELKYGATRQDLCPSTIMFGETCCIRCTGELYIRVESRGALAPDKLN